MKLQTVRKLLYALAVLIVLYAVLLAFPSLVENAFALFGMRPSYL